MLLFLLICSLLVLAAALVAWQWPRLIAPLDGSREAGALLVLFPFLPYLLLLLVSALGLRYGNGGLTLASLVLALTYAFFGFPGAGLSSTHPASRAVYFLLPVNLVCLSTLMRRRLRTPIGIAGILLVGLQAAGIGLAARFPARAVGRFMERLAPDSGHFPQWAADIAGRVFSTSFAFPGGKIPVAAAVLFGLSLVFLLLRSFAQKNALTAGLAGSLVAAFCALAASTRVPSPAIYFSAAGLILTAAGIETSFTLAYTDELTGLSGRRRLNEEMVNLGRKYGVAMIDVDHFKKFNDRYGHDAGDQVLRMIARLLSGISGGGQPFRYGGEEFTVLFPGGSVEEALPHLEGFRRRVAATPFVVRGKDRKKTGPQHRRGEKRAEQKSVPVTVSIGVAGPEKGRTDPGRVLKEADRALYRAKKGGRNRVCT